MPDDQAPEQAPETSQEQERPANEAESAAPSNEGTGDPLQRELDRLRGQWGGQISKLQQERDRAMAQFADLKEQLETLQNRKEGRPTDEERIQFENEYLTLKREKRELEAQKAQVQKLLREATIKNLAAKYPLVPEAELLMQEGLSEAELRAWAVETHYGRRELQGSAPAAQQTNGANGTAPAAPAKPVPSSARLDTNGAGAGSTATQQLTSAEMKQRGLQQWREKHKGAYEQVGLA